MTEAIKQWIADEAAKRFPVLHITQNAGHNSRRNQARFTEGLTKGIEIAEGFANFLSNDYNPYATGKWEGDNDETFTTSQLLEKYLKEINKP